MKNLANRKTATRLLLINWARFQHVTFRLEGSTLITGVNGTGKSTILDAISYLLTGNTKFNAAARDRDRTVQGYVRGDTRANGAQRYLRGKDSVVSYIVMEFWSPVERAYLLTGVCIESPLLNEHKPYWFVLTDTSLDQVEFARIEGNRLTVTPHNRLSVRGRTLKAADFLGRDQGIRQLMRALGLRCDAAKYRTKITKMMAFQPENNIDRFIQDCVLEPEALNSFAEIRQQREQFEQLRLFYQNLLDSRDKLRLVVERIGAYEGKQRAYDLRSLLLLYQQCRRSEEELEASGRKQKELEQRLRRLEAELEEATQRYEAALRRKNAAEQNEAYQNMQASIQSIERQLDVLRMQRQQASERREELTALQKKLTAFLRWGAEAAGVTEEESGVLRELGGDRCSGAEKASCFLRLGERVRALQERLTEGQVHARDALRTAQETLTELEATIKKLEANVFVLPKGVEAAVSTIRRRLREQGIDTEVRTVAELVQGIRTPGWRAAIETFLGWKRFHIIVDGAYCRQAIQILQDEKIYDAKVVLTDKLPKTEVEKGSAAEQLEVAHVYARRYLNYLLNGLHLCADLDELHEHPRGGIMRNGMLARGYAVSRMRLERTGLCLGADGIRLQLERSRRERNALLSELEELEQQAERHRRELAELRAIDWDESRYRFDAVEKLEEIEQRVRESEEQVETLRQNPDLLAVLEEQEAAAEAVRQADRRRLDVNSSVEVCRSGIRAEEDRQSALTAQLGEQRARYEGQMQLHLELKKPMLEEYERLRRKTGQALVIREKTVDNLRGELERSKAALEDAQLDYCRAANEDLSRRGISYIPYYRETFRTLSNVRIEEAREKLAAHAEKLQSAFMNDFVAAINERIDSAKAEMHAINRELKSIPFGQDTYQFVMREKSDRKVFFRICDRLRGYLSAEAYLNSGREDEEMERDIQELMDVILAEEDEEEYTDYRRYFTYDMEITSRQGEAHIQSDLSRKQGSASNGEKQTPYFIILAASLMQCYPRNVGCTRLALIDEAFSALSRERIEQMVRFFEDNHFQVLYAAPPEKISSIGSYIESTVSLVTTGRYTDAVDGLVKV